MEPVLSQTVYPSFSWESLVLVVVLILLGVMLLGFEAFVLPGFGVGGIAGMIFLFGGMVTGWLLLGPTWGALIVVGSIAASTVMFVMSLKSKFVKNRFILKTQPSPGGGTQAEDLSALNGATGKCTTDLRPAGIAEIDEKRVDVISKGDFIDADTNIRVVSVDGPRIVVERLE